MAAPARSRPGGLKPGPAFGLYLAALFLLGFKWLSPLHFFYEQTLLADLLVAASAIAFVVTYGLPRLRPFHWALIAYMAAGVLALVFASEMELGAKTLLLMAELVVLAFLTSEFAVDRKRLNAIAWVVVGVTAYSGVLAVVGLTLFYADVHTSLLGEYGKLAPSEGYARIAAGFQSGPLLGSYCIFASAILAKEDVDLPKGVRIVTQVVLVGLVLSTLSRAIIGFVAAYAIRVGLRPQASRTSKAIAVSVVTASVATIVALSVGRLTLDPTEPERAHYQVPAPSGRRENIVASFETFVEDPVTGLGPGALPGRDRESRAHLTELNILATMGLPALAAGSFLIVVLWRERRLPTDAATWSGLAGLAIDGLGQDIDHFRHVWIMFGLLDSGRRDLPTGPQTSELGSPARPSRPLPFTASVRSGRPYDPDVG